MRFWLVLLLLSLSFSARSERKNVNLKDGAFFAYFTGGVSFTSSKAGDIPGAIFSSTLTNPYTLNAGIGVRLLNPFYFGLRLQNWIGKQEYGYQGQSYADTLTLQAFGGEFGMRFGNPRMQYWFIGSIMCPSYLKMVRSGGADTDFRLEKMPYYYEARVLISLKMNYWLSFLVEGGYRQMNLGNLIGNGTSFIPSGENLNLSGPFGSVGIGFHF